MLVLRWLLLGVLIFFAGWVALTNVVGPIQAVIRRKNYSMVPFLGGLAGTIGLLLAPSPELKKWWWVPLVVDLGSGLLLLASGIAAVSWAIRLLVYRITGSRRRD